MLNVYLYPSSRKTLLDSLQMSVFIVNLLCVSPVPRMKLIGNSMSNGSTSSKYLTCCSLYQVDHQPIYFILQISNFLSCDDSKLIRRPLQNVCKRNSWYAVSIPKFISKLLESSGDLGFITSLWRYVLFAIPQSFSRRAPLTLGFTSSGRSLWSQCHSLCSTHWYNVPLETTIKDRPNSLVDDELQ